MLNIAITSMKLALKVHYDAPMMPLTSTTPQ
jgi:hypothetical protein